MRTARKINGYPKNPNLFYIFEWKYEHGKTTTKYLGVGTRDCEVLKPKYSCWHGNKPAPKSGTVYAQKKSYMRYGKRIGPYPRNPQLFYLSRRDRLESCVWATTYLGIGTEDCCLLFPKKHVIPQ